MRLDTRGFRRYNGRKTGKEENGVKRLAALVLLLLLLPTLVCCGKEKSPVGDYDTLEELAAAVTHPLYLPSQSGWIPVAFTLNERLEAEITYRMEKETFVFRMKPGEGHPLDPEETFGGTITVGQLTVSYCGTAGAITDAWWTAGDYGYGVSAPGSMTADALTALIASIR